MTNSYLSSRHKLIHFFFTVLIALIVFILILDAGVTIFINDSLYKFRKELQDNQKLELNFDSAIFEVFNGIFIKNLSISDKDSVIFSSNNILLKFDILNLLTNKKVNLQRVRMFNSKVHKVDYFDKELLSILLSSIKNSAELFKSPEIRLTNFNFMDKTTLDINGYVTFAKEKVFLTRGKLQIKESDFLNISRTYRKNSLLNKPLNYVFEGSFSGEDFIINKLDLASDTARLLLSGQIKDYEQSFDLDIKGDLKDFLLEDMHQLNNDYLKTAGLMNADFVLFGLVDNLDFNMDISISKCNLNILNRFNISKINSNLIWDNNGLHSVKSLAYITNSPVDLNLRIDNKGFSIINLEFISDNPLDILKRANLDFLGYLFKDSVQGDLKVNIDYLDENNLKNATLLFQESDFNFDNFKFLSKNFTILINDNILSDLNKQLKLSDLSCDLIVLSDKLSFDSIKANLYQGEITGEVSFNYINNSLSYLGNIDLNQVQMSELSKDFLSNDYELSGILSGKVFINSQESEAIKGDILIQKGRLGNSSVLISIANFFGIPSLRAIDFTDLTIKFRKIWDKFEAQIGLFSQDVEIYLDNQFFPDKTMDGYLLAELTTSLMDNSKRFKQLFRYIEYKEPVVYFPFKLRGYVNNPRIEWLKNEFKGKLQNFLSEKNKKRLQDHLNKMVVDFVQ